MTTAATPHARGAAAGGMLERGYVEADAVDAHTAQFLLHLELQTQLPRLMDFLREEDTLGVVFGFGEATQGRFAIRFGLLYLTYLGLKSGDVIRQ
jgi:hypothetical protein